MWHCHWDNGFVCPEVQECVPKLQNFTDFTCNYVDLNSTSGSYHFKANSFQQATIGTASTDQGLQLTRSNGICKFGIRNCEGDILSPVNRQHRQEEDKASNTRRRRTRPPVAKCNADAHVEFSAREGHLMLDKGVHALSRYEMLANVSTDGAKSYALFVNETGEITILGIFGKGDRRVLWSHPAPPHPTSGPCPTDFRNRTLKTIEPDTVNCTCIHTSKWTTVAMGRRNITGSWCSRLCQADPQYVAAAPRADGECWCATEETYKATIQASDCDAKCLACPGAPVEPCGLNNTVAIYKWEDDQPSMQPMQAIV